MAERHGRASTSTAYCVELEEGVAWKATALIEWLQSEYGLGRGHSMSVWAVWKSKGWVEAPKGKANKK